jgi:transposase-like protein
MDKRLLAITAGELPGVTVTSLCAELGISRKTYYEWRKRHDKEGPAGLEPRSRRPLSSPGQTPPWLEQYIVRLREQLPLDNGAQAIYFGLQRAGVEPLPHERTIHRVLVRKRAGPSPQPSEAPAQLMHRSEYDRPNPVQIDAHTGSFVTARPVLDHGFARRSLPVHAAADAVDSDSPKRVGNAYFASQRPEMPQLGPLCNGLCFTGGSTRQRRGHFHRHLAALGIVQGPTPPTIHRPAASSEPRPTSTLKMASQNSLAPAPWPKLQRQLDAFRDYYNHHRPTRARRSHPGRTVPRQPHSQTADTPLDLPSQPCLTIATRHVTKPGRLNTNSVSIWLGSRWSGRDLTVVSHSTRVVILDGTTLVRVLTLEPGRTHYPLVLPKS